MFVVTCEAENKIVSCPLTLADVQHIYTVSMFGCRFLCRSFCLVYHESAECGSISSGSCSFSALKQYSDSDRLFMEINEKLFKTVAILKTAV